MRTMLTIRTEPRLRKALEDKATAEGKSLTGLVREILEDAVLERPLKARISSLKGILELSGEGGDAWRRKLRERNWRQ